MAAGDRIRQARQVYARIVEATEQLDTAREALLHAMLAGQNHAADMEEELGKTVAAARRARSDIRAEIDALRAEAANLRAALRAPWWWALGLIALGAFAGHFLAAWADRAAATAIEWLRG